MNDFVRWLSDNFGRIVLATLVAGVIFWAGWQVSEWASGDAACDALLDEQSAAILGYAVASEAEPDEHSILIDRYYDLASSYAAWSDDAAYELAKEVADDIYLAREQERRAAAEWLDQALYIRGCTDEPP